MPIMNTDSDFEKDAVLLDETYPAVLKEVKQYQRDYGEGPVEKLAWIFEVTATEDDIDPDVEYEAEFTGKVELAAHTSYSTGRNSNFLSLGLDKFAGDDWDGDTDSLVGRECRVDVEQYKVRDTGEVRNGVGKVKPAKKKAGAGARGSSNPSKREPIEIDESDFADIPFRHMNLKARIEGIL